MLRLVTQALRPGLEISPPLSGLVWKKGSINKLCLRCKKLLARLWRVLRWRDADSNSENGLDETLSYCNDVTMNVTALVNASGAVVERYAYDPYGKVTIAATSFLRVKEGIPQGHLSLWLEEMKIPPLGPEGTGK